MKFTVESLNLALMGLSPFDWSLAAHETEPKYFESQDTYCICPPRNTLLWNNKQSILMSESYFKRKRGLLRPPFFKRYIAWTNHVWVESFLLNFIEKKIKKIAHLCMRSTRDKNNMKKKKKWQTSSQCASPRQRNKRVH